MSTDRELLELAAKANWAETEVSFQFSETEIAILFIDAENQDHNGCDVELIWNPLNKGLDTMQLAAKLKISIDYKDEYVWACSAPDKCVCELYDDHGGDYIESTMYAVTRAAAEIGRAMP